MTRSMLPIFLAILLFASFGCITENRIAPIKKETIQSRELVDLDGDGIFDYGVYEFSEINEQNVKIKRRLSVSTVTSAHYTSYEFLTDLSLLKTDGYLETFSREKKIDENFCANRIGIPSISCIDVRTCANLCSANSMTCKKIASEYPDLLGGSMLYFVQDTHEIDNAVFEARNLVLKLRTASDDEKNVYLGKLRDITAKIASINANPLIFHPKLNLCPHANYGIGNIVNASKEIGNFSTEVTGYNYIVTLEVEPLIKEDLGSNMNGITVEDAIPVDVVSDPNALSSHQSITSAANGSKIMVGWSSSKASDAGYILYYKFSSDKPPEEVADSFVAPTVTIKTLDLSALGPTNSLFVLFYGITNNYPLSLGFAVGLTFVFIFFVYTILVLAINIVTASISGAGVAHGIKAAFGKVRVRWQIDGAAALFLLIAGFYISMFLAPPSLQSLTLISSFYFIISEPLAFAGFALILLGSIIGYSAVENLVKITILERIYGVSVRAERGAYLKDIATLKEKINLLKKMVKDYAAEDFDVSEGYDAISSIPAEKIKELEKKMTVYSRAMLDDYLSRINIAIEKLEQKKKLADENWPAWKEAIVKMLTEHNEVHASALVAIPESLRAWALTRYMKENIEEGLVLEGMAIKRRKVSPIMLIKEMVSAGLIKGGIILKKENIIGAWFEGDQSPTVATALTLKLRLYLASLAKEMKFGELASFVSVGDQLVYVTMRVDSYDTAIFVNKEKFKDAIEAWKKKVRMLSEES